MGAEFVRRVPRGMFRGGWLAVGIRRADGRRVSGMAWVAPLIALAGLLAGAVASARAAADEIKPLAALLGHRGEVESIAISPDGKILASGGTEDQTLRLWDLPSGRERARWSKKSYIGHVSFSTDGKSVAASSGYRTQRRGRRTFVPNESVDIWDVATGKSRVLFTTPDIIFCLKYSPDGTTLAVATAGQEGRIRLWDIAANRFRPALDNGSLPHVLPFSDDIAFSRDGSTMFTSNGAAILLWDTTTWQQRAAYERNIGAVSSLAVSPDGRYLASPTEGNTVRIWYLYADQLDRVVTEEARPLCVGFSPDGKLLVVGDGDGSLRIHDTTTFGKPVVIKGHKTVVRCLAFTPDGTLLASSSKDSSIKLWRVADLREAVKKQASQGAPRTQPGKGRR